jgi:hypothetical protein
MQWVSLISTILSWIFIAALFFGRKFVEAEIENRVEHRFNERLERLRAELQTKANEIAALREGVFSGRMQRQALLDKRRMEAVERAWASAVAISSLKTAASLVSMIKFDVAAREAAGNAQFRDVMKVFLQPPPDKLPNDPAKNERPFLSPLAWAYLSAYRTILLSAYMRLALLTGGIEKADTLLDDKETIKVLKAALPHQAEYIDTHGYAGFYYLLDELQENLLIALQITLDGSSADEESIKQSVEIMDRLKEAERERAEAQAQAAQP